MIASRRNAAVAALAADVRRQPALYTILRRVAGGPASTQESGWSAIRGEIERVDGGEEFVRGFENVIGDFMDVAYDSERLAAHPDWLLGTVLELASVPTPVDRVPRDDAGVTPAAAPILSAPLRSADVIADLPALDRRAHAALRGYAGEGPRQLTGQPTGPGLASGLARSIRGPADLALFRAGEILVCDSIQPAMTHLVPLADAIDTVANGELLIVDGYLGIVTVGTPDRDLERLDDHNHTPRGRREERKPC